MMSRQTCELAVHKCATKRQELISIKIRGSGSFLSDKWMWQSVTKNWVCLINTVAVSESWPDWHIKAPKTQGTAAISNKKTQSPSPSPTSSLTLPHTQQWPFSPNCITVNGGGKLWKKCLFVLCWQHKQIDEIIYVDSLKSAKQGGRKKKEKKPVNLMFFFFLFFHEVLSMPAISLSAFH